MDSSCLKYRLTAEEKKTFDGIGLLIVRFVSEAYSTIVRGDGSYIHQKDNGGNEVF